MNLCHIDIVIIDDDPITREGCRSVLGRLSEILAQDFEMDVHCVATVAEAEWAAPISTGCRLALLDLNLVATQGVDTLRAFRAKLPCTPVVILSSAPGRRVIYECLSLGALGFIRKDSTIPALTEALRHVLLGGMYMPSDAWGNFVPNGTNEQVSPANFEDVVELQDTGFRSLTAREKEVLRLLVNGHSNKQIARELNLSAGTTKNYVSKILNRYRVTSRAQLIASCLRELPIA